jgi:hypothetical protein
MIQKPANDSEAGEFAWITLPRLPVQPANSMRGGNAAVHGTAQTNTFSN